MSADRIRAVWEREPADSRVVVLDGYGISATVHHGQLVLRDGLAETRRERIIPRIGSPVQRVIVLSPNGYATLGALSWMTDNHVGFAQLDRDGNVVASGSQHRDSDVALIRAQAATPPETALSIVQTILTRKIEGQAKNLYDLLGASQAAARTEQQLAQLADAPGIEQCRLTEARAASVYFGTWTGRVEPRFDRASAPKIPAHWTVFNARESRQGTKRYATSPLNAILNYCYSIAYAEAVTACVASGLDPRLGYLHKDSADRASLALDILETVRPVIDRLVIGLVNERVFSHRDFTEATGRGDVPPGTVRLVAPLTHELAELAMQWQQPLRDTAEMVRAFLLGTRTARRTRTQRAATARPTDSALVRSLVPDQTWAAVRKVLPVWEGNLGKRPVDDRLIVAVLVYRAQNGTPWRKLPARFGVNERTVRDRVRAWRESGHWAAIAQAAGLPADQ